MTKAENTQAIYERAYWRKVGRLIGPNMMVSGWNILNSAGFVDKRGPAYGSMEVSGKVAEALLEQQGEIASLKAKLIECHCRACTQQNCTLDGGPEHRLAFPEAAEMICCQACSEAGGADMPVYHAGPSCKPSKAKED